MPRDAGEASADEGSRDASRSEENGLIELVEEIVAAARLLLLNVPIQSFEVAGVSVAVRIGRRIS